MHTFHNVLSILQISVLLGWWSRESKKCDFLHVILHKFCMATALAYAHTSQKDGAIGSTRMTYHAHDASKRTVITLFGPHSIRNFQKTRQNQLIFRSVPPTPRSCPSKNMSSPPQFCSNFRERCAQY